MGLHSLKNEGWANVEIAQELGCHPATVAEWLDADGPPGRAAAGLERPVMTERWRARIEALLGRCRRLLATSVHNRLLAEGFGGSCPTVVRAVREIRGPRFRAAAAASAPVRTGAGEEAQFDFCDLDAEAACWGWDRPLRCFGAILCWSRTRMWWFTTSEDQNHTFEGLARAFECFGGVPAAARTDRMGALGSSQGRRFKLHPAAVHFAAHHGTKITPCRAGDAKRKGKIERCFRQLRETFLPEVEAAGAPTSVDELNRRAHLWLDERVHAVASRSTGVAPNQRAQVEAGFLAPLPAVRFDTDYVCTRRVHNVVPLVAVDAVRYSAPPNMLGQLVEIRRRVDSGAFEIRWAGNTVAHHRIAGDDITEVWADDHRRATVTEALSRHDHDRPRRHLRAVTDTEAVEAARLDLGAGDFDIEAPDLAHRYSIDDAKAPS